MPIQKLPSIDLYYQMRGRGDPILFLCGLSSTHKGWDVATRFFSLFRQTIAIDYRDSGKSGFSHSPYTIETLARDVIDLLDALSIEKVDVIGSSMGAAVALTLLSTYPSRMRRGFLVAPFAKLPETTLAMMRGIGKLLEEKISFPLILQAIVPWLFSDASLKKPSLLDRYKKKLLEVPNRQLSSTYFGQWSALEKFDLRNQLQNISSPVFILSGKEDRVIPPSCVKYLINHIDGAQSMQMDRVGHMVRIENERKFLEEASFFLLEQKRWTKRKEKCYTNE